jgi:hypothetical protein
MKRAAETAPVGTMPAHCFDKETLDPHKADDRNFYKVEKWTQDRQKVAFPALRRQYSQASARNLHHGCEAPLAYPAADARFASMAAQMKSPDSWRPGLGYMGESSRAYSGPWRRWVNARTAAASRSRKATAPKNYPTDNHSSHIPSRGDPPRTRIIGSPAAKRTGAQEGRRR